MDYFGKALRAMGLGGMTLVSSVLLLALLSSLLSLSLTPTPPCPGHIPLIKATRQSIFLDSLRDLLSPRPETAPEATEAQREETLGGERGAALYGRPLDANSTVAVPHLEFPGISVHGAGAVQCTVGELCSFTLHVAPTATWQVLKKKPLEWDLMVTLEGPALVHAYIDQSLHDVPGMGLGLSPGDTFSVTYRSWDAGLYAVTVTNPCATLAVQGEMPRVYQDSVALVAEWTLTVTHARLERQVPGWQAGVSAGIQGNSSSCIQGNSSSGIQGNSSSGIQGNSSSCIQGNSSSGEVTWKQDAGTGPGPMDACQSTLQGRWVRNTSLVREDSSQAPVVVQAQQQPQQPKGKSMAAPAPVLPPYEGRGSDYHWEPYPCATWQPIMEVMEKLYDQEGVREIAFIGDSHMRYLLLHTGYLITGEVPVDAVKAHYDFRVTIELPGRPANNGSSIPDSGHGMGRPGLANNSTSSPDPGPELGRYVALDQLRAREEDTGLLFWRLGMQRSESRPLNSTASSSSGNSTSSSSTGSSTGNSNDSSSTGSHLNLEDGKDADAKGVVEAVGPTSMKPKKPRLLHLSFYWVDGVYHNEEFGCFMRGRFSKREGSFPEIHSSPDMAILGSGTWSAFACKLPMLAYSKHLNEFLADMAEKLNSKRCSKTFFFGSIPHAGCQAPSGAATNSLLWTQNKFARLISAHHGMRFFNTWEVIAPRYTSNCQTTDPHYSCVPAAWGWNALGVRRVPFVGPVGEAVSRTFFQFVLSHLQKSEQ